MKKTLVILIVIALIVAAYFFFKETDSTDTQSEDTTGRISNQLDNINVLDDLEGEFSDINAEIENL